MSESFLEIPGLDLILQSPGSLSLSPSASDNDLAFQTLGTFTLSSSSSLDENIPPSCINNERSPSNSDDGIPSSVRNAPKQLRRTIRRKQNKESARRGRERRYAQMDLIQKKHDNNHERIRQLEIAMDQLLSAVGIEQNGLKGEEIIYTGKHDVQSPFPKHDDAPWHATLEGWSWLFGLHTIAFQVVFFATTMELFHPMFTSIWMMSWLFEPFAWKIKKSKILVTSCQCIARTCFGGEIKN